jgi:hypothetical protein
MGVLDLIRKLEKRRSDYQQKVRELDITIATLRDELGDAAPDESPKVLLGASASEHPTTDPPIPWTQHIRDLFKRHEVLDIQQTRELLEKKGIPALDEQYAGVVQATLARLMRMGELERVGKGVYRLRLHGEIKGRSDDTEEEGVADTRQND